MSKSKKASAVGTAASAASTDYTTVSLYDIDNRSPHECGYCKHNGSISIGMTSEKMRVEDYQLLIDRGWRRSGTYLYKPVMDKTCCPLYTIRCDATKFQPSRSQRNTLKNVQKHLKLPPAPSNASTSSSAKAPSQQQQTISTAPATTSRAADKVMSFFLEDTQLAESATANPAELLKVKKLKAKHKRLFRKLANLKRQNKFTDMESIIKCLKRHDRIPRPSVSLPMVSQSLEDYMQSHLNSDRLKVTLVRSWPPSEQFASSIEEEHQIYAKYQSVVHGEQVSECDMRQFKRFLCLSPLIARTLDVKGASKEKTSEPVPYGSFHQQYRLDGRLIAVGVIDILSTCVSSVYFFYDPEFKHLNLGKYSALHELALVRRLNSLDANISWYYLGFYVHTCQKMRYKGLYSPSYLLCPEAFSWHPIEACRPLIELTKYSRFSPNGQQQHDSCESIDQVHIRVKLGDNLVRDMKFVDFCRLLTPSYVPEFTHLIEGYCKLFGKSFAKNVFIKFS